MASLKDKGKKKLGFSGTLFAQFNILKWMTFRTEVSGSYNSDEAHAFTPEYYINDYNQNADAIREETITNSSYLAWRNQLNMNFKPMKGHKLGVMLGHEMSANHTHRLYGKRCKIGSPHPDFSGGLGNTFTYKDFDLNFFFTYSVGGDIMNWLALTTENPNERMYNITKTAATDYAKLALIDPDGSEDNIYNVYVASGAKNMYRINPTDANSSTRLATRGLTICTSTSTRQPLRSTTVSWPTTTPTTSLTDGTRFTT